MHNESTHEIITGSFTLSRINKNWVCIKQSGISTSISKNNISISFRNEENSHELICRPYELRYRREVEPIKKIERKPVTAVSEISIAMKKRNHWINCKKTVNKIKLDHGAIVFAKQAGYSPWPCKILKFNKSRSSATVEYFGFNNMTGTVKTQELVQIDDDSKEAIGSLITFTLQTKCIRDHESFGKAVRELEGSMNVCYLFL